MESKYVIGVDYGSDSVRSIIANATNGDEVATAVFYYPRWKEGKFCEPSQQQFRQHPLDYIEGLEATIQACIRKAGPAVAANIKALSVDTTGSTPVAVDKSGTPLALLPEFSDNPHAMFVLWKDHTATAEAAEINAHAQLFDINYLQYEGGIYSSEWFWAKLLRTLRVDKAVREACYSWVEHCDWIPFLLTGGTDVHEMKRSTCAAGHKALWAAEFGGLPPDSFFSTLDPLLAGFTGRLFSQTYASDKAAGTICKQWANRLGLPEDVVIGIGAFDAHMGAAGGQIESYHLSKVMGTSTCDMLVAPLEDCENILVKGICGQVPGSVIPGMMGLEAGQSAFGDAYAWFKNLIAWPLQFLSNELPAEQAAALQESISNKIIAELSKAAAGIEVDEKSETALDWFNGRRTPDANQLLKGAISGLHLGSDAPRVFRAIVEATCFGAKNIVERFEKEGIPVKGLIGLGGVARKSPFIMQMMEDVINMPIRIHKSEQTCAAGAAMFAATVAGLYPTVTDAMKAMGQGFDAEYVPDQSKTAIYKKRYQYYLELGAFAEKQAADTNETATKQKIKENGLVAA